MEPLPHEYRVDLTSTAGGHDTIGSEGLPPLRVAPPVQYGGPGDAWSPEHLLLASVQACFLFTLRAVARASNVEFHDVRLDTVGVVDKQGGAVRFTDIALTCDAAIAPGTDRERALRVLARAEKACLVSASLAVPVRLYTNVREAEAPAPPARAA